MVLQGEGDYFSGAKRCTEHCQLPALSYTPLLQTRAYRRVVSDRPYTFLPPTVTRVSFTLMGGWNCSRAYGSFD